MNCRAALPASPILEYLESLHTRFVELTDGQVADNVLSVMATCGMYDAMVSIPTEDGVTRLDSFSFGMTFGDVAFIDRSPGSANVSALSLVECRVLTRDAFARLDEEAPAIKIRLLQNLACGMTAMLRRLSRERAALK
jgi:hypothetical protein